MTTRTVPREPTQVMIDAGNYKRSQFGNVLEVWRAMFDAAPTPQEVAQPVAVRIEQRAGRYSFMEWKHWRYNGKLDQYNQGARVNALLLGPEIQQGTTDEEVLLLFPHEPTLMSNMGYAPSAPEQPEDDLVERLRSYGEYVSVSGGPALKMRPADCVQAAARIEDLIAKRDGAIKRGQMLFDAKNEWVERARIAESALAAAQGLLRECISPLAALAIRIGHDCPQRDDADRLRAQIVAAIAARKGTT